MSLIANNNQKPTWKLVVKTLKADKFRTFCILFAICTCTFVMTFLPCFNTLDYLAIYDEFREQEHASFTMLSQENTAALSQDSHFEKNVLEKYGDFGRLNGAYARPVYQQLAGNVSSIHQILKGNFPQDSRDILIDSNLAQKLQADLGDSLTFQEKDGNTQVFQVCGITESASGTSVPCFYVSDSFAQSSSMFTGKDFSLKIWLKPEFLTKGFDKNTSLIRDLALKYGIPKSNLFINYYSIDTNPLGPSMVFIYVLLDLLVLVIGLLVIYSIFCISIMSRIRAFGQMQTLGMTSRQIRRMVNQESSLLCVAGSLGGILPGLLLAGIAARYWSAPHMIGTGLVVLICSYVFIMAFLQKPARTASRITPWEAVNYQEDPFCPVTGKLSCRLLGHMRAKNNRQRMFLSRLSMIVGGIFFLLTATYMSYYHIDSRARSSYFQNADYILSYDSQYLDSYATELVEYQKQDIFNQDFLRSLENFPQVDRVFPIHEEYVNILTKYGTESSNMIAFDKETFALIQPYLKDSQITYEDLVREGSIIFNPIYDYETDFSPGNSLTLSYYDGEGYQEKDLPMGAIINPKFSQDNIELNSSFLVPAPVFEELYPGLNTINQVYIRTEEHTLSPDLEEYLKDFMEDCPLIRMSSFEDYQRELTRQNNLFILLFAGATLIVIIFSVLNLLNATLNKMITQNRELALFEAVGMSRKEIKKMLLYECLYISRMPLIISWITGSLISYLFYIFLVRTLEEAVSYVFPLFPLLLWSAFVLAVPSMITLLCYRHFTKTGLMERLKRDK